MHIHALVIVENQTLEFMSWILFITILFNNNNIHKIQYIFLNLHPGNAYAQLQISLTEDSAISLVKICPVKRNNSKQSTYTYLLVLIFTGDPAGSK